MGALSLTKPAEGAVDWASPVNQNFTDIETAINTLGRANLLVNGSVEEWSSGTSSAPDGWTLAGTGATIARDGTAANVKIGTYSAGVTNGASNSATLKESLPTSGADKLSSYLQSRTVTFACWVKASSATRARLLLEDSAGTTNSSYHTGGGSYELLKVTRTIDAGATSVAVGLEIATGAAITVYIDGAVLVEGTIAAPFAHFPVDSAVLDRAVGSTRGDFLARLSDSWGRVAIGANRRVVSSDGTDVLYQTIATILLDILSTNGDIVYRNGSGVVTRLGIGSSGQVLKVSSGLPAWGSAITSVAIQVFTSSGTYTPTSGMQFCLAFVTGAGGGGGGADGLDADMAAGATGGAAGGTVIGLMTAATVGASRTITIGGGGAAGSSSGGNGGAGGSSSISGGLMTGNGGNGGIGVSTGATANALSGPQSTSGSGTEADIFLYGGDGHAATGHSGAYAIGGNGGASFWGGGGRGSARDGSAGATLGSSGFAYGAGGGGASCVDTTTGASGGSGAGGVILILEFI